MFSVTVPTWGIYAAIAVGALLLKILVVVLVIRAIKRYRFTRAYLRDQQATVERDQKLAKEREELAAQQRKAKEAEAYASRVLGHWLPLFKAVNTADGYVVRTSLIEKFLGNLPPHDLTVEGLNVIRAAFFRDLGGSHEEAGEIWERIGAQLAGYVEMK